MFSREDVREIFRLFPPSGKMSASIPSLVLSADGQGFIALPQLEARFKGCVTNDTQRIPLASISRDLDVDEDVVLRLAHSPDTSIALVSADGRSIVTASEREALQKKFTSLISKEVVSNLEFRKQNDIDLESLNILFHGFDGQLITLEDHVYSRTYENDLSNAVSTLLKRSLEEVQSVHIVPNETLGSPPLWFINRILKQIIESQNLVDKFHVQEETDGIHCTPKQLTEGKRDAVVGDLQSGALAYINLQTFCQDFPELFATFEDAHRYFEILSDVEMMDLIAVSRVRVSSVEKECVQILRQSGVVNLSEHLVMNFPDSLLDHLAQKFEQAIILAFEQSSEPKPFRVGSFLLTEAYRKQEQAVLLEYAKVDAASQWEQLKENPEKDIKFSLSNIAGSVGSQESVLNDLIKEKTVEKALDEQFWASVSEHETQNEADFSIFWLERVISRCHIYNEGLSAVEDQKLRDQLAELFATYAQKELLLDSVLRARSQGLALSRKTRKNIQKLETKLSTDTKDVSVIMTTLDRFNKKQSIEVPAASSLQQAKEVMIQDMKRRMQKQKKSDGPVLFLTLVVLLFARHYPGVVYATGKFAPKLLKQLKSVLETGQYEQLERWKEAAKTSTLSAEDREEMKQMAEA
ncbi:hypothetical protein BKA66DRAFT_464411 [Pyrenochaeta sp. MPI-SDFR-AT-0127]|nr:hypothetical protein BKA66DRAFT_464411 [Pyrenochaeta sp. MPI-SDFR-AT-0127]